MTQLDVRRFLSGCDLEPQGEGNELRNLSVLFSWAVQFHHMTVNPCKGIQTEESGEKEPPRVLTIREVKELIDLALTEIKEPIRVGKGKSGKGKMSIITVYTDGAKPDCVAKAISARKTGRGGFARIFVGSSGRFRKQRARSGIRGPRTVCGTATLRIIWQKPSMPA